MKGIKNDDILIKHLTNALIIIIIEAILSVGDVVTICVNLRLGEPNLQKPGCCHVNFWENSHVLPFSDLVGNGGN